MGERIRAFDWANHPMGPPATWPAALHAALGICLNSSFPTAIYWGRELWLLYNDAWAHIPAERHPWALGRAAREVWTDIWGVIGPQFEQVLDGGHAVSTFDELLPMARNGRIEETYWNYSLTPIIGENGAVAGVFNQGHETTAQVLAARSRDAETERLRELFEQAPGAIAVLSGENHIFEIANASYIDLIGGRRDIIGRSVAEVLPEVVSQGYVALLGEVYRTGVPYIGEDVSIDLVRNGEVQTRVIDFIYQPTRAHTGAINGVFVQATDVTERKQFFQELQKLNETLEQRVRQEVSERLRAEDQLRQAQKMEAIGQLTGGIAHDFNNMLAVVIGALNQLQRRLARGDTNVSKYVESALESAKRASGLTQRLLAFARQQPLDPAPLDLNALVESMQELLTRTLGEHITIETNLAEPIWPIFADRVQLESAILNLAVNARDAMPQGGALSIATQNLSLDATSADEREIDAGDYVVLSVTDTGAGMSAEVLGHAFEPFFTTKEVGKGTGLGLSQVFGFVRQSGGHVDLQSRLGQGTVVRIYLPRSFGAAIADTPAPTETAAHDGAGEVVLVVEDDERVRNFSTEALRELGYTVLTARGGAEALQLLESAARVDLLFTDMVMPDMNGRQLADAALKKRPTLKVLFTTGYMRHPVLGDSVDAAAATLHKPFTLDQLAAKVRLVLEG